MVFMAVVDEEHADGNAHAPVAAKKAKNSTSRASARSESLPMMAVMGPVGRRIKRGCTPSNAFAMPPREFMSRYSDSPHRWPVFC